MVQMDRPGPALQMFHNFVLRSKDLPTKNPVDYNYPLYQQYPTIERKPLKPEYFAPPATISKGFELSHCRSCFNDFFKLIPEFLQQLARTPIKSTIFPDSRTTMDSISGRGIFRPARATNCSTGEKYVFQFFLLIISQNSHIIIFLSGSSKARTLIRQRQWCCG